MHVCIHFSTSTTYNKIVVSCSQHLWFHPLFPLSSTIRMAARRRSPPDEKRSYYDGGTSIFSSFFLKMNNKRLLHRDALLHVYIHAFGGCRKLFKKLLSSLWSISLGVVVISLRWKFWKREQENILTRTLMMKFEKMTKNRNWLWKRLMLLILRRKFSCVLLNGDVSLKAIAEPTFLLYSTLPFLPRANKRKNEKNGLLTWQNGLPSLWSVTASSVCFHVSFASSTTLKRLRCLPFHITFG